MTATSDQEKRLAAARAVGLVENGMTVGLGTGSTAAHAVRLLGLKVSEGLRLRGVATSEATRRLALECGIALADPGDVGHLDLTIDGADEVDPDLNLIKGGGGALLREKIVAAASERLIIIVDSSKLVERLGRFALPVEVVRFGWQWVARGIETLGGSPVLRVTAGQPFATDEGHYILDCAFGAVADPGRLSATLDALPGLVEHGLFVGMADTVIVGRGERTDVLRMS